MTKLPRLKQIDSEFWVDEAIWGHRLYNEQTPWMMLLEFLVVLQSELEAGRPFREAQHNTLKYKSCSRLHLRNILFNNPRLEAILEEFPNDNEGQWRAWLEAMKQSKGGISDPDFSYLRSRFGQFRKFATLVQFLRSNAIEGDSNKRWSSKFVFPYGPHAIYEDLNIRRGGEISNDRRFFARTGELLYLMLSRSGRGSEILTRFEQLNLVRNGQPVAGENQKWDQIIAAMQPESDLKPDRLREQMTPPYLPYESLPEYGALADDWLRLLDCRMPGFDVLPHLVTITGLHLTLYLLNRARQELGLTDRPTFVIEIVSPKKNAVRDLSADSCLNNNQLSLQAVKACISRVRETPEWQRCESLPEAVNLLNESFAWPDEAEAEGVSTPKELLEKLLERAETRHKQHLGQCHASWTREIGLSSSRGSRRTRYAPTDSFLKTLVLTTVYKRDEFQDFLARLYDKYGLIIGHTQAGQFIKDGQADKKNFTDNSRRLEERLASMGLLKRLSDACAYVQNPVQMES
jgi:hypothetical protein